MIENRGGPLSQRYPLWLCDVWGVVHNGVEAFPEACEALIRHRGTGGKVVLLTNAPRPSAAVQSQLANLKVSPECYDGIVSSGDVTRQLVSERAGARVFHLGPERDLPLLEGLPVSFSPLDEAEAVLLSGLIDDETEKPEDYRGLLEKMAQRKLDMICANPDKVVRRGDRLIPCAGAIAALYETLGGRVLMAGKPYEPIYRQALDRAAQLFGEPFDKSRALAIGDGMATDVLGAADNDLALMFIAAGINDEQLSGADAQTLANEALTKVPHAKVVAAMSHLVW